MNEELERAKMIIDYYEDGEIPLTLKARIKLMKNYWRYRNANNKHNTDNDTSRNNTISDDRNNNTWDNELNKIFNG